MGFLIQIFLKHNLVFFAILIFIAIFFWVAKFQKQLDLKGKHLFMISLLHVIIGWSSMRLLAIIEVGGDFERAANMRIFGAIFVLPVLYYLFAKKTGRNVALMMDVASVCLIFGTISGRLNCLINGCCKSFPVIGEFRLPIREAELLYYGIFLLIFCRKILRGKTNGEVYPIFLISYGALRFVCEFVREEYTGQIGPLHLAHIWSLVSIAAGIFSYIMVKKQSGRKAAKKSNPLKGKGGKEK